MLRQTHVLPMISIHDALIPSDAQASVLLLTTIACALPLSTAEEQSKSIPLSTSAQRRRSKMRAIVSASRPRLSARCCVASQQFEA